MNANYTTSRNSSEINLIYLFFRILDKLHYIILSTIIAALLVMLLGGNSVTRIYYMASSSIFVANTNGDAYSSSASVSVAKAMMANYISGFGNLELHQRVVDVLELPYTAEQLRSMVSLSNAEDTYILKISIASSVSAEEAQSIANTYAEITCDFFDEKFNMGRPSVFEEAALPSPTISTSQRLHPVVGAMVGMALSFMAVLVWAIFDNRLRTPDDLAQSTSAPFLGGMTTIRHRTRKAGK